MKKFFTILWGVITLISGVICVEEGFKGIIIPLIEKED